MEDITLSKTTLEQKFNCLICWGPKLRMVYGSCQHRLCENCLYDEDGKRRAGVKRCPVCCKENSFPERRPIIPEDNVEVQVQLGVRKCLYDGCGLEMWHWELFQHLMNCPFGIIREKAPPLKEQQRKCINTKTPKKYKTRKEGPVTRRTDAKDVELEGASWLRSGKRKRISLE